RLGGDRPHLLRPTDDHKVVPAHMAQERRRLHPGGGAVQTLRQHRDELVAATEPVPVVDALEAVDIDVADRVRLLPPDPVRDLPQDPVVTGSPVNGETSRNSWLRRSIDRTRATSSEVSNGLTT